MLLWELHYWARIYSQPLNCWISFYATEKEMKKNENTKVTKKKEKNLQNTYKNVQRDYGNDTIAAAVCVWSKISFRQFLFVYLVCLFCVCIFLSISPTPFILFIVFKRSDWCTRISLSAYWTRLIPCLNWAYRIKWLQQNDQKLYLYLNCRNSTWTKSTAI